MQMKNVNRKNDLSSSWLIRFYLKYNKINQQIETYHGLRLIKCKNLLLMLR